MDPRRMLRSVTNEVRKRTDRPRSRRLTFAYDAEGVRLQRHTDRMKQAPPSQPLDRSPADDAVVAEVRDAAGTAVYRAQINDALPSSAEVFDPDGSIRRERYVPERGMFTVVVPIDRRSDHVVVDAGPAVATEPLDVSSAERVGQRIVLGRFGLTAPPEGDVR